MGNAELDENYRCFTFENQRNLQANVLFALADESGNPSRLGQSQPLIWGMFQDNLRGLWDSCKKYDDNIFGSHTLAEDIMVGLNIV